MNKKTKSFLNAPTMLTKKELSALVGSILHVMYVEDDELNPDKEWSSCTIEHVCGILSSYKLVPRQE